MTKSAWSNVPLSHYIPEYNSLRGTPKETICEPDCGRSAMFVLFFHLFPHPNLFLLQGTFPHIKSCS